MSTQLMVVNCYIHRVCNCFVVHLAKASIIKS